MDPLFVSIRQLPHRQTALTDPTYVLFNCGFTDTPDYAKSKSAYSIRCFNLDCWMVCASSGSKHLRENIRYRSAVCNLMNPCIVGAAPSVKNRLRGLLSRWVFTRPRARGARLVVEGIRHNGWTDVVAYKHQRITVRISADRVRCLVGPIPRDAGTRRRCWCRHRGRCSLVCRQAARTTGPESNR